MLGSGVGRINQDRSYHANMNGHGWQFSLDMVGNAMTLGEQEIVGLNIPTGIPLVYELTDKLEPLRNYYLGDPVKVAVATQAVANQGKAKA